MLAVNISTRRFDVYAPLQDFYWPGNDFDLSPGLKIKRITQTPDLSGLENHVSRDEWERATNSDHWLTFEGIDGAVPSPAEVAINRLQPPGRMKVKSKLF